LEWGKELTIFSLCIATDAVWDHIYQIGIVIDTAELHWAKF